MRIGTLAAPISFGLLIAGLFAITGACSGASDSLPYYSACTGANCANSHTGNSPGTDAGSDTAVPDVVYYDTLPDVAYTSISGTVKTLNSVASPAGAFNSAGTVTISGGGASGYPFAGGVNGMFNATQVPVGSDWFSVSAVSDTTVSLTWSLINVTSNETGIIVPIANTQTITQMLLSAVQTPLSSAGQVIVSFVDSIGNPVTGAKITTPSLGAALLYDSNYGSYSANTTQTGTSGVAIIVNVTQPISSLSWTSPTMSGSIGTVMWQPSAVTMLTFLAK